MDLVIYHDSCSDGFCAAFVAHEKWPNATFLAQDYGLLPPYSQVEGKDVLVVDFSWHSREENEKLAGLAKSFRILDHHKSQAEVLAGLPFATFDLDRSGAGLAWDYLFGKDAHEKIGELNVPPRPRPWWVDYTEDRDLWRFKLPNSKVINAYLGAIEHDFTSWDVAVNYVRLGRAYELGLGAQMEIQRHVREGIKQAQYGMLFFIDESGYVHEYKVAVANTVNTNFSEIGGALADLPDVDVAMGWFERYDGKIQFGLRAHKGADVSKLARIKGGGGHKATAGFELNIADGRVLIDSILGRPFAQKDRVFQAPPIISLDKNVVSSVGLSHEDAMRKSASRGRL